jgi:hypothetical protein
LVTSSRVFPRQEVMPIPVTTTRRSAMEREVDDDDDDDDACRETVSRKGKRMAWEERGQIRKR